MSNIINKFSTFYRIPLDEDFEELQKDLITYDYRTGEAKPFGYVADSDGRFVRVPAGIGDSVVSACYPNHKINYTPHMPFNVHIPYSIKTEPYEFQETIIRDITEKYKDGKTQVICDIPTGNGKTFTAINIIHRLNVKAIVFVKTVDLALQWLKAYRDHTTMGDESIFLIQGLDDIRKAVELADEHNVFIITHASIRKFYMTYGFRELHRFFSDLGVGMKVYDEFDLEVKNTLMMDCNSCVKYNLYLTATVVKSSYNENEAFKFIYQSVYKTGKEHFKTYIPNRKATVVFYESKPNQVEFKSCMDWNMNFVPDKYMAYMLTKDEFYEALTPAVEHIKAFLPNKDLKFIFYVGKIINCDVMREKLNQYFNIPIDKINVFNSSVNRKAKDVALSEQIITSTTDSMGRGLDIKGIKVIVNCEIFGSESIFKQLTGRIGRKNGDEGYYYEIVDLSFKNAYVMYKKRQMHFKTEFKEVKYLNIKNGKTTVNNTRDTSIGVSNIKNNNIDQKDGIGILYTSSFYKYNQAPVGTVLISTVRKLTEKIKIPDVIHMPDLSPSYRLIFKFKEDKDLAFYNLAFDEEMKSLAFQNAYSNIKQILESGKNVCLMAYESDDRQSHRSMIADKLTMEGYNCVELK
ncbi:MAG: DUF488 family protein, N3 subclade [Fusobacteriaceae bacterium]